jgi:hypothetical protein
LKKRTIIFGLSLFLALGFLVVEAYSEETKPEVFTGNAVATGGPTTRLTITIDKYSNAEEAMKYIEILKNEGQAGLRKVLEKVSIGWIAPTGRVREAINFARSLPQEDGGRIINILKARYLQFIEFALSTPRSREYDFTFIQLKVDKEGNGEGYMFAGTKVEFNKEGKLVLEQRGTVPIRIRGVKLRK